jgi:membrane protein DedA with SNARE-associated domain
VIAVCAGTHAFVNGTVGGIARRARRLGLVGVAAALLLVVGLAASAWLQGDLPDVLSVSAERLSVALTRFGPLGAIALLYVEESGIPLLAPGDVFVMYAGAHVPREPLYWVAAWSGLIAAVTLGATNLYLISRHLGGRLVHGRFAGLLHLTPERLARAERWFERWGVWAIIFGRHVPGLRVPITVAAGVLRVPYPTFAGCVAVSTAVWAGVWLVVGITLGGRVERFLHLHDEALWLLPALIALVVVGGVARWALRTSRERAAARSGAGSRQSRSARGAGSRGSDGSRSGAGSRR